MGGQTFVQIGRITGIEATIGTLENIHIGLVVGTKIDVMNGIGVVTIRLVNNQRWQNLEPVRRAILNGFNQNHIGFLIGLGIDKLNPLRCQLIFFQGVQDF